MGKTIGIVSLKGGVGKTSIVAALGGAFSNLGKKVLLVDGNLSSPSLGLHLNLVEPKATLHDVLNRTAGIKDAIYKLDNFDIMPASVFTNLKVNPFLLKSQLKEVKKKYDVILLDSSPSLDAETLGVMLASDEIFVVTTPDHPTMSASIKAAKIAKQRGNPITGIILNKVHKKDFELPLSTVEDTLEMPVLAVVPYDTNVLRALANMQPYTVYKPRSEGSEELMKLAATLSGEKYSGKPSFMNFFRGFIPTKQDVNREIFYEGFFK
ncbi:MAG: AAA family ATPase [Candidatus Pacearchaeota archaeon]|jgi:septum site-determining protein MinD